MKNYEVTNKYVNEVYKEMDHYIIIGLTGRCGSGCSSVRDILCGKAGFNPKEYMHNGKQKDNKDRDREILLNFMIQNPIRFDEIRVRHILTSYILQEPKEFFMLLNALFPKLCGDGDKIKEDFYIYFKANINLLHKEETPREYFDDYTHLCNEVWKKIDEDIYNFIEYINEEQYNFLFLEIQEISRVIRDFLINRVNKDAYTLVYQHVGNLLRSYGTLNISYSDNPDPRNMYTIAKRINQLLKIMRRKEWILKNYKVVQENRIKPITKSPVYVVIDSIKNIFESEYLKARYHSFYLLALTLNDEIRKQRLKLRKELSELQIEIIDTREQSSKAKKLMKQYAVSGENIFSDQSGQENLTGRVYKKLFCEENAYSVLFKNAYMDQSYMFKLQDVDTCIQNADILINNGYDKSALNLNIMRYICLMQHPGLVIPTLDERCMQIAQSAKLNSGCISRQVGAAVCDQEGNILSIGWNEVPVSSGNECINCGRRSFEQLIDRADDRAYSYYELYNPDYRRRLTEIMDNMLDGGVQNEEEGSTADQFRKVLPALLNGLPSAFCFKDIYSSVTHDKNQVHTRAQHAEEIALESCDKNQCEGGTLYTTSSSCELCSKKALNYNIKRIVYIEPYSGIANDHVLGHEVEIGTEVSHGQIKRKESISVELFTGATQGAYNRLYSPIFPLKDELHLRGANLQ